jgi:cell division protein FtsI (penicillin-binding protein 3)
VSADDLPSPDERPAPRRSLLGHARDLFRLRVDKSTTRVAVVALGFTALFGVIGGRLVMLAIAPEQTGIRKAASSSISAARPDIVDRNGETLAADVKSVSIFAEPRNIIDKDEAVELLTAVLPDVNARELRDKLGTKRGFVWVKREVTPRQQAEVHRLGIPGVGFLPEHKRVYPNGHAAAHVLGFANVDNVGIAGMEKYIDSQGLQDLNGAGFTRSSTDLKPVELSIDLRVQHALRDELAKAMEKYRAKATAGMVLDVNTGEVVALVSLPDFDPTIPSMPWRRTGSTGSTWACSRWARPSRLSRSRWLSIRAATTSTRPSTPGASCATAASPSATFTPRTGC